MPPIQIAYLGLVVVAFVALGVTLAWVAWWSNQPPAPRRQTAPKTSMADGSRGLGAGPGVRPTAN